MTTDTTWQTLEQLVQCEARIKRAEYRVRQAERKQHLAEIGIGCSILSAVFAGAYLIGLLLLYLMPAQ